MMETTIPEELRLKLFRQMLLNRYTEEELANLYRQGRIPGGLFLSRGQEATSVGTAAALEDGDILSPMIRNIGAVLYRGMKPGDIFRQCMALDGSFSRGRDSGHHFGNLKDLGILAPISQLGKMISVMMGIALSFKSRGLARVAINYIGDGGSSTGDFHEALNMAGVLKVPLVLILENNQYAYSTHSSKQSAQEEFFRRGEIYGIHGERMNGNDVEDVYQVTRGAVARARAGEGPALLESYIVRIKRSGFLTAEELASRDPLLLQEKRLIEENVISPDEAVKIKAEIQAYVREESRLARKSSFPDQKMAWSSMYSREVN